MDIKPLETATEHEAALKAVETLMTTKANKPEGARLKVLVALIENDERKHFPMKSSDPTSRGPQATP